MNKRLRKKLKKRNLAVEQMIQRSQSAGPHNQREQDVAKGRSRKPKHRKALTEEF